MLEDALYNIWIITWCTRKSTGK